MSSSIKPLRLWVFSFPNFSTASAISPDNFLVNLSWTLISMSSLIKALICSSSNFLAISSGVVYLKASRMSMKMPIFSNWIYAISLSILGTMSELTMLAWQRADSLNVPKYFKSILRTSLFLASSGLTFSSFKSNFLIISFICYVTAPVIMGPLILSFKSTRGSK